MTYLCRTIMQNKSSERALSRSRRLSSTGLALTAGLFAIAVETVPATATHFSPFQYCAAELRAVGISTELAASTCSDALNPTDLSACVFNINRETQIASQDALAACLRVRRPIELGRCVINISQDSKNPPLLEVLESCRRSLLPIRFAECVVGLNRQLEISATKALDTCISADNLPRNLSPTFAPPPPPKPTPDFTPPLAPTPQLTPLPNLEAEPVVPATPVNP